MADAAEAGREPTSADDHSRRRAGSPSSPSDAAQDRAGAPALSEADAESLPVRADETHWSAAELRDVRGRLEDEIDELRAEIARSETDIAERLGDVVDGAGDDQADAGAKTFAREHELALTQNAREMVAQTDRAIERIDAGTYGACESCGQPIGKARLQAFPRATLCVACKQREERR